MNDWVDLHLHSTYSDGVLTPAELLAIAASLKLKAVALADHDNVDGIDEAIAAGRQHGVEVIPGVELSVVWEDLSDLHLLGYGFDHRYPPLVTALADFRTFRAQRGERILDNINRQLVADGLRAIDPATVGARAGGTLGRPHIGAALVEAGHARDMEEAFQRFLIPHNEPKRFFPIDEAIALVHAAGGCAVLAHPPFIPVGEERLLAALDRFIAMGLDGLEAYSPGASNDLVDSYITIARQRRLIVTGGSDFHQPQPGGVVMGRGRGNLKIPYRCVSEIHACTALIRDRGG